MKKKKSFFAAALSLLVLCAVYGADQFELRLGETLTYEVGWKAAQAGTLSIRVVEKKQRQGRSAYKLALAVESNSLIDMMFPVRDRFESWIDEKTFSSSGFALRTDEGGKRKQQDIFLNPITGEYKSRTARPNKNPNIETEAGRVTKGVQDYLSALYFLRRQTLAVGKQVFFVLFDGDEEKQVAFKIIRKETITVPAGTFPCFVGEVLVKTDTAYAPPPKARLFVWLSDDAKKVPVQFQAEPAFGQIDIKLK